MKIVLLFVFLFAVLNSCASLINSPFQKVRVDHDPGINIKVDTTEFFYRESTIYNVYIPKKYTRQSMYFLRCKYEIPLIVNDMDTIKLESHRSFFSYWLGNIYMTGGLGMLIDYPNDKSFQYPVYNYIVKDNDKYQNIRFKPIKEGSLHFALTIPTINVFYLQTDSGKANTLSGLGISGQLEYFLKNNLYLSLNAGTTMDLFSPAPDSVNFNHHYFVAFRYYSSSSYLNFRINKMTPRIEYGVGINLSTVKWSVNNITHETDTTRFYNQSYRSSFNFGLSSAISYRLSPNFNIGLQYQPLIFDLKRKEVNYQHFVTAQMIWRF